MSRLKKILKFAAGLLIIVAISLIAWLQINRYPASQVANDLIRQAVSDSSASHYYFKASSDSPKASQLVIYGGALVETSAYSPLAIALADKGYDVYLLKSPLDLAILNQVPLEKLISPNRPLVLLGHSLGGVKAAQVYAALEDAQKVDLAGLILLAAYPSKATDLRHSTGTFLSLWGNQDRILNQEQFEQARQRLPLHTNYQEVKGGNHAQYADYGPQEGDGNASISINEQIQVVVSSIETYFP